MGESNFSWQVTSQPCVERIGIARDLRNARGLQNCLPTRCALRSARLRRDTGLKSGTRNRRKILEPVRRLFRLAPRMSREGKGRGRKISLERWTLRIETISRRMPAREDVVDPPTRTARKRRNGRKWKGDKWVIEKNTGLPGSSDTFWKLKLTFHVYRKCARW